MRKFVYLIITLLITDSVTAQKDSIQVKELDEVVITATKYPLKLSETGKVLTVITKEQIEHSAGKDLGQLLNEQTGIVVNGANSNAGKDKSVFVRGALNKYTLILLDGVPVTDPTGVGGAFDIRMLSLNEIERIEILKGSQSTLYGSDAVAGVINIITRKVAEKKIEFIGGASFGTYNSFNGNAGLSGHSKIIDYNLNYNYTSTDGISEATDTIALNSFDKDDFRRQAFQTNLTINAAKHLKISPYYRYSYYKGDFDADAFTDAPNKFSYLLNNTGAIASYELPKGTVIANYGYSFIKRDYTTTYGNYGYRGRFNTGEIYITQTLSKALKVLAGINLQRYILLDTTLAEKNPAASIFSPYISFLLQNSKGLSVETGSRFNHHSKFGSYLTYSVNASYLINNRIKIFANASTGFKAPTLTELFGLYGANENLKPEKSKNFEGGIQASLVQKKLIITATGFKRNIKDLIAYVDNLYVNVDEQKDKGIELEARLMPDNKWNIRASYTYVTGSIQQTRNNKDTNYYNLIRRPKNAFSVTVSYEATKHFYVSIGVQNIGKRTDLFFQQLPPYGTEQINLKSYALINAYAEYKFLLGRLRFFIDAKNLTDTHYTEVYGYNTLGLNINGGINFRF